MSGGDSVTARRQAQAHRRSVQISTVDLLNTLVDKLGPSLVALIVNKDRSSVARWVSQKSVPGNDDVRRALMTSYQIFQLLEGAESDHTIRAWFIGMNPQLDDQSPAEAISEGDHRGVMAAARAFLSGG